MDQKFSKLCIVYDLINTKYISYANLGSGFFFSLLKVVSKYT